eukprot:14602757-Ditylum_brightwellii.AAC.1
MEPLSAIIVAFTDYCQNIATTNAEKLHQIRASIKETDGPELAVLANALPCIRQCFDVPSIKVADV